MSHAITTGRTYASLAGKLNPQLLKGLEVMGYTHMTPVQERVLTDLPNWQSDCLVQAKTGTGKTIAFLLPALHSLLAQPLPPRGCVGILCITPTRELAQQIAKECDQLTAQLSQRLECHIAVGGTARASTLNKFMSGSPSILIATPGRLNDYLSEEPTRRRLDHIRTLVLDEADTMLDTGFMPDIKRILQTIPPKSRGWQGMCFSATVPPKVKEVVSVVLRQGYTNISTVDKNEIPTHERVSQTHVIIPHVTSTFTALASLLSLESQSASKIIVFAVTANMVHLFSELFRQGLTQFQVFEMHSRLSQNARTKTTEDFKAAAMGIMFASDVIGRGMDFPNVDLVVQVGLPSNGEQYIHRVGRTARAGNDGRATILLTEQESWFLTVNRYLPIKPHASTGTILQNAPSYEPTVTQVMSNIDQTTKAKAYSSYLGFFAGSGMMKKCNMDKAGLVRLANEFAEQAMLCPEPPPMEKSTIGKMGLKGVPGLNIGSHDSSEGQGRRPQNRPQNTQTNGASVNRVGKRGESGGGRGGGPAGRSSGDRGGSGSGSGRGGSGRGAGRGGRGGRGRGGPRGGSNEPMIRTP